MLRYVLQMLWLLACVTADPLPERGAAPEFEVVSPVLKRLTQTQYGNSLRDLLGSALVVPNDLEPDDASEGLLVLGGTVNSLSARGVEQYETAAFDVAAQVRADSDMRAALMPCAIDDAATDAAAEAENETCVSDTLEAFGHRAWRRPLEPAELLRLTTVASAARSTLGSWDDGVQYGVVAILQSPNFLYRIEVGEDDPDAAAGSSVQRRYTSVEMATRLSYFLWNSTPDAELLAAGESGELVTDAGIDAQVERMLADPRGRDGVRNFFDEMLTLYKLEDLSKDPTAYVHTSSTVGSSAREETLSLAEWLTFDEDGDYRDFFTTTTTFVDPKLATIYAVPAPSLDGFAQTELPADGGRRGFLGQVSFLALQAHPTSTSPTRRGKFIREVLFCTPLSPPPANVDTSIPEPSDSYPTMRARLEEHMSNPSCAGCHAMTDPIGLGFENFDGLGGWRATENGNTIDASGDLDGAPFNNAWGLAAAVHDNANLGPCFSRTLYQYATGHAASEGERDLINWHAEGFADNGYKVQWLLRDLVASPGFRRVGVVQ